jgi:hypothetical protein
MLLHPNSKLIDSFPALIVIGTTLPELLIYRFKSSINGLINR